MKQLAHFIKVFVVKFNQFGQEELLKQPAADKWCKKEILGHLIDSAINNLKRFTDIQFLPQPYIVQSYRQNELVQVNNDVNLPLEHLLSLWQLLNRQIFFIVENIPAGKFHYPVNPQYDNNEMKTLGWIICDYGAHMEHHWKQVV
ncbi:MAG: DinB family protein [Bacteroidota bacterium]